MDVLRGRKREKANSPLVCRSWNAGSGFAAGGTGCRSAAELPPGSLSTSVIGMFPKEIGEFAYADLKSARKFPWFPQLRDQLLPSRFRQFEKFLASAGVDPDTQVDELAWGAISATKETRRRRWSAWRSDRFDPSSSEARFKAAEAAHSSTFTATTFTPSAAGAAQTIFCSCSLTRTLRRSAIALLWKS